ncbi:hypothetical protein ACQP00_02845 [Dactylosporangium sp. CS-047395]|uniref:hypothetical protein n=1 Tax=Dactylosporangium sp. CS-047395 TaxID=3239936 RepID=UPI003D922C11
MAESVRENRPPEPPPKPPEVVKPIEHRASGARSDSAGTASHADAQRQTGNAVRDEHAKAAAPVDGSLRPSPEFQAKLDDFKAAKAAKGNGPAPGDGSLRPTPEFQQRLDAHQAAKAQRDTPTGPPGERAAAHERTGKVATAEFVKATAPAGSNSRIGEEALHPAADQSRQSVQGAGEQARPPARPGDNALPSWAVPTDTTQRTGLDTPGTGNLPRQSTGEHDTSGQKAVDQHSTGKDALPSWAVPGDGGSGPASGENPQKAHVTDAAKAADQPSATPRADSLREKQPDNIPGPVWDRICNGVAFNEQREPLYQERGGANEITLENGKRLDSYVPGDEIVSRKFSQLDQVDPATAAGYVREVANKYSPEQVIADTPKNREKIPDQIGQNLRGVMVLEIPPQDSGSVPREAIAAAWANNVTIRDTDGKSYMQPLGALT